MAILYIMNLNKVNIKSALQNVLILLIYILLSLFFWGFPSNFNKLVFGNDIDPIAIIWSINWFPYALSHGLNPFISHTILNPIGVNLVWSPAYAFTASLLMFPVTVIFGPIVSYNMLTLLSPALSAFTAFLLCKYLSKNTIPALMGGYIYGFSSYEIGQLLGHLNLFTIFLIPLIILICTLFYQNKVNKFLFLTILIILLILQFGFSLEIFTTLTFFGYISLIIAFIFINQQDRKKIIILGGWVIISYIITMIILLPFLYYLYLGLHLIPTIFNDTSFYSSDLLNFIIPTPITWLGGNQFSHIASKFSGNFSEEGAYIGIPLIFISYLYIKEFWHTFHGKLLIISGLIIIIASFGPFLKILGTQIIQTPWKLLIYLPLIKQALPTRFTLYLSLVLAIIITIWLSTSKYNKIFKYSITVLSLVFLIPNLSVSFKGVKKEINIPPFFTQKSYLKYIKPNSNVLIIPYSYNGNSALWQVASNMYFNMIDYPWYPVPLNKWSWLNSNIVANLIADTPNNIFCIDELKGFLGSNDIEYVIVSDNEYDKWGNIYSDVLGRPSNVGGIFLYKISDDIHTQRNDYKNAIAQCNFKQFAILFSASIKFLENNNQLTNLYPQYLEEHDYLDKSLGYQTKTVYNWTQNSGWIGQWPCSEEKAKCFGVGIVGNINEIKPIIEKYSEQAKQIYFPYPKKYDPNIKKGSGQLLMIFMAEQPSTP